MKAARDIAEVRLELASCALSLPEEDVRLLAAIAAELPSMRLAEGLEAETEKGVEHVGRSVEMPPTSRRVTALSKLLSTLDAWRALLGLPARPRRTVGNYLRGERRTSVLPATEA